MAKFDQQALLQAYHSAHCTARQLHWGSLPACPNNLKQSLRHNPAARRLPVSVDGSVITSTLHRCCSRMAVQGMKVYCTRLGPSLGATAPEAPARGPGGEETDRKPRRMRSTYWHSFSGSSTPPKRGAAARPPPPSGAPHCPGLARKGQSARPSGPQNVRRMRCSCAPW